MQESRLVIKVIQVLNQQSQEMMVFELLFLRRVQLNNRRNHAQTVKVDLHGLILQSLLKDLLQQVNTLLLNELSFERVIRRGQQVEKHSSISRCYCTLCLADFIVKFLQLLINLVELLEV